MKKGDSVAISLVFGTKSLWILEHYRSLVLEREKLGVKTNLQHEILRVLRKHAGKEK